MQVLVFDVASGQAVVNSNIPGLKEALGVATEAPFISVSLRSFLIFDLIH
jgi:hypothetical protein